MNKRKEPRCTPERGRNEGETTALRKETIGILRRKRKTLCKLHAYGEKSCAASLYAPYTSGRKGEKRMPVCGGAGLKYQVQKCDRSTKV
jgi:hypothetical protein